MSDPLSDVAVPAPNADPHSMPSVRARARALADQALAFAKGDVLASSPFVNMAPGQLYQAAQAAGRVVDQTTAVVAEAPSDGERAARVERGAAIAYSVSELASHMNPVEVRAVLVFLDAQRRERGERSIYVAPDNTLLERPPLPPPMAPPSILPPSPSGIYRCAERKSGVALPGGVYTINQGADYDIKSVGRDFLESMVQQGVKLKPYPDTSETAGNRATCNTCSTSWLMVPFEGRQPFNACPACYALTMIERERSAAATERERMSAELADAQAEAQAAAAIAGDAMRRTESAEARVGALTGWAVAQGAPPPAADGFWHTEGNPASMCPTAPLTFSVKAEFPARDQPEINPDFPAAVAAHGVSDDTGLDVPAPAPSAPEEVSSADAAFDTETPDPAPTKKGGNSKKPPKGA